MALTVMVASLALELPLYENLWKDYFFKNIKFCNANKLIDDFKE